jgi:hypothetical protein
MPLKEKISVGADVTLGLMGILLTGIEIGKSAVGGDVATAATLAIAAISALASGNINSILSMLPMKRKTQQTDNK